jgi:hypothetical protein
MSKYKITRLNLKNEKKYSKDIMFFFAETLMKELVSTPAAPGSYPEISQLDLLKIKTIIKKYKDENNN